MSLQHPAVRPWERSLTFAAILAILPVWKGEWDDGAECIYQQYEAFAERIRDLGLPDAIDKPLLLNVSSCFNDHWLIDISGQRYPAAAVDPSFLTHHNYQTISQCFPT